MSHFLSLLISSNIIIISKGIKATSSRIYIEVQLRASRVEQNQFIKSMSCRLVSQSRVYSGPPRHSKPCHRCDTTVLKISKNSILVPAPITIPYTLSAQAVRRDAPLTHFCGFARRLNLEQYFICFIFYDSVFSTILVPVPRAPRPGLQ